MPYLTPPLEKMRLTQPFGVDWTGSDLYAKLGMKGHNGWDLRAGNGTEVRAVMEGIAHIEVEAPVGGAPPGYTSGYGINVKIRNRALGLEAIYGHLQNTLIKDGEIVSAGQPIALSDSTGISSGPHLHLTLKRIRYDAGGAGPFQVDGSNGYFGAIDPAPFFSEDVFMLPVDRGYGLGPAKSELAWYVDAFYIFRKIGRLVTAREKKALLHGRWDLRTVLDDALFPIWSEMSKLDAIKKGIVKKIP